MVSRKHLQGISAPPGSTADVIKFLQGTSLGSASPGSTASIIKFLQGTPLPPGSTAGVVKKLDPVRHKQTVAVPEGPVCRRGGARAHL